jgi:hypothetical protein
VLYLKEQVPTPVLLEVLLFNKDKFDSDYWQKHHARNYCVGKLFSKIKIEELIAKIKIEDFV